MTTESFIEKRKSYYNRKIESFELTKNYYIDSFNNGNKSHVSEEISYLMIVSLSSFLNIFGELPTNMQKFILDTKYYNDASLYLTLSAIKRK
jgi:hypothetical protein